MALTGRTGFGIRGHLSQAVYARQLEDEESRTEDHAEWYVVRQGALSEEMCDRFIESRQDEETFCWLEQSREKSDSIPLQMWHSLASWMLGWVITKTSINGLLKRGSMFIFSQAQLRTVMNWSEGYHGQNMIDLGAGDGGVTSQLAGRYDNIYVTEMSKPMQWRLSQRNYTVLPVNAWHESGLTFDLVSCLNLLDRCADPLGLLTDIRESLAPGGRLLLSMVLPYNPYVEFERADHQPVDRLEIQGDTFEAQVTSLVHNVLEPAGFQLFSFTRLPYLCEGDLYHSFYVLHDAVLVLGRREDS